MPGSAALPTNLDTDGTFESRPGSHASSGNPIQDLLADVPLDAQYIGKVDVQLNKATLITGFAFTWSTMPVRWKVLNPDRAACSRYGPMGRLVVADDQRARGWGLPRIRQRRDLRLAK